METATTTKTFNIEELKKKPFDELTEEEFEYLRVEKHKIAHRKRERERKAYEEKKHNLVLELSTEAIEIHEKLKKFNEKCHSSLLDIRNDLNEYGDIRGNSKGGFSITTADNKYKVRLCLVNMPVWDERAAKAEELLHDFLGDTVKKRDKVLHDMLLTFLEKNKDGKFEYARVQLLYQHEAKFNDPRWLEALKLFKESFKSVFAKNRVEFSQANEANSFEPISLNMSRL